MKNFLIVLSIFILCQSCNKKAVVPTIIPQQTKTSINASPHVEALIAKMTLEEKIGQMTQFNGFWDATGPVPKKDDNNWKYDLLKAGKVGSVLNVSGAENVCKMQEVAMNSKLGIPLIFGLDVIHGHKVLTPIPLAESCSWNLDLIETSAANAAKEAAARGINWTFAPMVDISRDARWGRVMEGGGEDPYLGSLVGAARVKGFQGSDLKNEFTIAACVKHFAGYGFAESGKDYNTADVGTSTLYNTILPPFKACVDAGALTVMNSFNVLNGIPATGDKFLQRDVLKDQWGFEGFIVSDWGSAKEMIDHGFSKDLKHAAVQAANAGSDMDMESYAYITHLAEAVNEGLVDIKHIDDAVRRILTVKEKLGLFDDPYKYCNTDREKEWVYNEAFNKDALALANESIVLLRNENNTLPLDKSKKIAVIGTLANDKTSPLGNWRMGSDDGTSISVLEGLKNLNVDYSYAEGAKLITNEPSFVFEMIVEEKDKSGFQEAIDLAPSSDQVIMVLGEHGYQSGEGRSRSKLNFPGLQEELLRKIYEVNKNIVLVVMSGRPLVLTWANDNLPAIVQAWQLGTESGNAIAQTLYGDNNPSGKLTMSFPRSVGQMPLYYNPYTTGRPGPLPDMVFWSHYIDESNAPLYPFGFGLSYSTFTYSNLTIDASQKNKVMVGIDVTNESKREGKEVVQLYLQDKVASVVRPITELKGFEKITLGPKESKRVEFVLTSKELGFFDNVGKFVVEGGEFNVMVGGSSSTGIKGSFNLQQNQVDE